MISVWTRSLSFRFFDVFWQRLDHLKKLRMSHQELKPTLWYEACKKALMQL